MEEKKENIPDGTEDASQKWRDIPFDATTNFSILGWLLERTKSYSKVKKIIDFYIEE